MKWLVCEQIGLHAGKQQRLHAVAAAAFITILDHHKVGDNSSAEMMCSSDRQKNNQQEFSSLLSEKVIRCSVQSWGFCCFSLFEAIKVNIS